MKYSVPLVIDEETQRRGIRVAAMLGNPSKLADYIGMSRATVSDILNGKSDNVSLEAVQEFRNGIGLPPLPEPRVVVPSPRRNRKKRYSVPTHPVDAARYLAERMTIGEMMVLATYLRFEIKRREGEE